MNSQRMRQMRMKAIIVPVILMMRKKARVKRKKMIVKMYVLDNTCNIFNYRL